MQKKKIKKKKRSNKAVFISVSVLLFLTAILSGIMVYTFATDLFTVDKQNVNISSESDNTTAAGATVFINDNDRSSQSSAQYKQTISREEISSLFEYYVSVNEMTVNEKEEQKGISDRASYFKTASLGSLIVTVFIPQNIDALDVYYDEYVGDAEADMKSAAGYTEKIEMIDGMPYYRLFFKGNGYIIMTAAEQEPLAEHAITYMKENTER